MKAIVCGANGAMGKLIQTSLGDRVAGLVSRYYSIGSNL